MLSHIFYRIGPTTLRTVISGLSEPLALTENAAVTASSLTFIHFHVLKATIEFDSTKHALLSSN